MSSSCVHFLPGLLLSCSSGLQTLPSLREPSHLATHCFLSSFQRVCFLWLFIISLFCTLLTRGMCMCTYRCVCARTRVCVHVCVMCSVIHAHHSTCVKVRRQLVGFCSLLLYGSQGLTWVIRAGGRSLYMLSHLTHRLVPFLVSLSPSWLLFHLGLVRCLLQYGQEQRQLQVVTPHHTRKIAFLQSLTASRLSKSVGCHGHSSTPGGVVKAYSVQTCVATVCTRQSVVWHSFTSSDFCIPRSSMLPGL